MQLDADGLKDFLFAMRGKGLRIWGEQGRLRYQAPRGLLSGQDGATLRLHKREILAVLLKESASVVNAAPLEPRKTLASVPLTPTQSYRFRLLHRRYSSRVPTIVRLVGRWDDRALRLAIEQLVRRHEALRTRFPVISGQRVQVVDEINDQCFCMIDLTALAIEQSSNEANAIVDRLAREKIDPSKELLFKVTLIKLQETDHLLLLLLHDCLSDAISDVILWRDLWALYVHNAKSKPLQLPSIPIQLADFASWLRNSEDAWTELHSNYWRDRLSGARHVKLFVRENKSDPVTVNRTSVFSFRFDARLTDGLRSLTRRQKTSLGMVVLSVWAALILQWTQEPELVVGFLSSGRVYSELGNTIGCFMAPLFLRIGLHPQDSFLDLLCRVAREYSEAYEHHDFGRLLADAPVGGFGANTLLNWLPYEMLPDPATLLRQADTSACGSDIQVVPLQFAQPQREDVDWDGEPAFAVFESQNDMLVKIFYRIDRVAIDDLQTLAELFCSFAEAIEADPSGRISTIPCKLHR